MPFDLLSDALGKKRIRRVTFAVVQPAASLHQNYTSCLINAPVYEQRYIHNGAASLCRHESAPAMVSTSIHHNAVVVPVTPCVNVVLASVLRNPSVAVIA